MRNASLCEVHHSGMASPAVFSRPGARLNVNEVEHANAPDPLLLALCVELNFTRAARRSGVSQPSLTNAISALERELGGALFQRRPFIALTALGRAMQPYLERIAQNADHARETAQALIAAQTLIHVPTATAEVQVPQQAAQSPEYSSS
jgi:Bacterial regulatory helix-turn-helix protein, lysR family